jgi:hypothetical protein
VCVFVCMFVCMFERIERIERIERTEQSQSQYYVVWLGIRTHHAIHIHTHTHTHTRQASLPFSGTLMKSAHLN